MPMRCKMGSNTKGEIYGDFSFTWQTENCNLRRQAPGMFRVFSFLKILIWTNSIVSCRILLGFNIYLLGHVPRFFLCETWIDFKIDLVLLCGSILEIFSSCLTGRWTLLSDDAKLDIRQNWSFYRTPNLHLQASMTEVFSLHVSFQQKCNTDLDLGLLLSTKFL